MNNHNQQKTSIFGQLSEEEFLRDYWQKKPLFVKSALPSFDSPLRKDDVIELASREDANSRLVLEEGGEYEWEARFGPFDTDEFDDLDNKLWTVLVQEVDQVHSGVRQLLAEVPFLPNWRIDDVMVSFATDLGGVGAHIDQYDVFLIQGIGQRKWEIMRDPVVVEELVPDLDVRILAHFDATDTWIVEPGDLLYLPPNVAHRGTAIGECLTYSIGCRAPSKSDLINGFFESIVDAGIDSTPFSTHPQNSIGDAGRVGAELKSFAVETLNEITQDESTLHRWLGRFISQPRRDPLPSPDQEVLATDVQIALESGAQIKPVAISQVMFDVLSDEAIILYAGGKEYEFAPGNEALLQRLCDVDGAGRESFSDEDINNTELTGRLAALVNSGVYVLG